MSEGHRGEELAASLITVLSDRGLSVATAESLTGGLIAATLTAIPGASACVLGGMVTYTDALKHRLLGVDETVLAEHGAVSEAVAAAMAAGARDRTGADLAVSATGYAGPGGEAGLVWLGIAAGDAVFARRFQFPGGRAAVRAASVIAALTLLTQAVERLI